MSDVLGKQQWFREYRESEGIEELPFVGSFGPTDPVTEVAGNIREVIDVDGARQRASNWEGFMRELTRNAEQSGIMIMRSGVVGNNTHRPLDVEEVRGFSVSDHVAPLIFINGQDFRGAQIFTLAHEMAHIWAGGVCRIPTTASGPNGKIAQSNSSATVAAETLVPGEDFRSRWSPDLPSLSDHLRDLSRHYKVSAMVILRQAHDFDLLPTATYRESYSELVEQASKVEPAGEPGGNFYYTLAARNGQRFTEAVISSAAEGTLMSSEAADMLGVKVKTLPGIAGHFFGSPLTLA